MNAGSDSTPQGAAAASAGFRAIVMHRGVQVTGYAALGQVGGWILGPALGYRAFGFQPQEFEPHPLRLL